MTRFIAIVVTLSTLLSALGDDRALALPATQPAGPSRQPVPFVLGPPPSDGPVIVHAAFHLEDINDINDEDETFQFSGVLTLTWHDPRQAFDPAEAGVNEKIFQGSFQFDEISPGWYPQVVLVNQSGSFESTGVLQRVQPDGACTVVQAIHATVEVDLRMRLFPFDRHRLEAVFEVLGYGKDEVAFKVDAAPPVARASAFRVPQWTIDQIALAVRDRPVGYAGTALAASTLVLAVQADRQPLFVCRLVALPLGAIVLLSFSVFWMDRSSLGDRISVSFIGILTGVTYQLVVSGQLPRISYVTLMHAFLSLSFLTMSATVFINLLVGARDKQGKYEAGNRIDRRCRWLFPMVYVGMFLVLGAVILFLPD